jgi:AcrR family transcriptional regulator
MNEVLPRGRRADSRANHARILDAARSLLAERGLDVEVDEVAKRAGVGVGTLYAHFTNRDGLLRAVLSELLVELMARVRAAAAIEDPVEALRQIPLACALDPAFFTVLQDPRIAKLRHDAKGRDNPIASEQTAIVADILERGIQTGAFRPGLDPRLTASAILASIGGVIDAYSPVRPLDDLVRTLADLHYAMVAAR